MSIFNSLVAINFVPVIGCTIGAITSYTINQAAYLRNGILIEIFLDFTITNNGTGAGLLTVVPPVPIQNFFAWGSGREVGLSGKMVFCAGANLSSSVGIGFYDGTYPGATNARIRAGWFQA